MELNANYWEQRYLQHNTPWDLGGPSPALTAYLENIDRSASILVPGAGHAYEAEWLINQDFTNIHVLDYSAQAVKEAKERFPNSDLVHWHVEDFFDHNGAYDVIVEQTFFCALDPILRMDYALKMKSLLKPGGILMGLLFDFPLTEQGPPFGGSKSEYLAYFEGNFQIEHLETCSNSIKPRAGREIFIELRA